MSYLPEQLLLSTDENQQSLGLERWRAELAGEITPPPELRVLRRRYGWTDRQINVAFEAFAGIVVHPVNGKYVIFDGEIALKEASMLMKERLLRINRDGWSLTPAGEEMFGLLCAYGDSKLQWAGSSSAPFQRQGNPAVLHLWQALEPKEREIHHRIQEVEEVDKYEADRG